jgi:glutaredoxin-like YruB-family protein
MLKVYSTPQCSYCVLLKNWLKENKVLFEDIDVSADNAKADEMVKVSGQMGVPVIDLDGQVIVGFDQDRLKELLHL